MASYTMFWDTAFEHGEGPLAHRETMAINYRFAELSDARLFAPEV